MINQWTAKGGNASTPLFKLGKEPRAEEHTLGGDLYGTGHDNETEQKQRLSLLSDLNRADGFTGSGLATTDPTTEQKKRVDGAGSKVSQKSCADHAFYPERYVTA